MTRPRVESGRGAPGIAAQALSGMAGQPAVLEVSTKGATPGEVDSIAASMDMQMLLYGLAKVMGQ